MRAALISCVWLVAAAACVAANVLKKDANSKVKTDAEVPIISEAVGPGITLESLTQEQATDLPIEDLKKDESRVIDGTSASIGQFPFVVYLQSILFDGNDTLECGGALISDNYVITAAQCVASAVSINVIAGDLNPKNTTGQSVPGIATIHPGFRKNFLVNDIALVKLLYPVTLGVDVYPIKMTKTNNPNALDLATLRIFGWGNDKGETTGDLTYVDMVQLSKSSCQAQTIDHWIEFPATTSCISSTSNSNGFCNGDVGGPVTHTANGDASSSLVGVLSHSLDCPSRYPMAYTRIGPYLGWIRANVKNLLKY